MKRTQTLSALLFAGLLLGGCSTHGASITPSVHQANLASNTLEFAVGTANIGQTGTVGLNTVVSYRQSNGNSAVLVDTPTLTGPAGFTVPSVKSAGTDAGTNHISGSPQQTNPALAVATTFGQAGGAFSYGFAPFNSGQFGVALYPGNPPLYAQPFYGATTLRYYGGPPAYPFFNDGTYPSGFAGYPQGFTMFNTAPVGGTYNLSVLVPASNAAAITASATATLSDLNVLPTITSPTFVDDAAGTGASGVVTIPSDPRIVETLVYVYDSTSGAYYTAGPISGTGAQTYTIPGNLGACSSGAGCENTKPNPTFTTGDAIVVYAASFDYPAFEASPPGSKSANPTITGANGQADITTSSKAAFTY